MTVDAVPPTTLDGVEQRSPSGPLDDAATFVSRSAGDAIRYDVPSDARPPDDARLVWFDAYLETADQPRFRIELVAEDGRRLFSQYCLQHRSRARVTLPLYAFPPEIGDFWRDGRHLRTFLRGSSFRPGDLDWVRIEVRSKGDDPVTWHQTPVRFATDDHSPTAPVECPDGPVVDALGQDRFAEWPHATDDEATLVDRLSSQFERAADWEWPDQFSRWGGWREREFEATGFFDVRRDGDSWWLVDPDGHPFFSTGVNCVNTDVGGLFEGQEPLYEWTPDRDGPFGEMYHAPPHEDDDVTMINYLVGNQRRAFGDDWRERWGTTASGLLRRWGFNTVGNWSERDALDDDLPYVRQLDVSFEEAPTINDGLPDVYHDAFERDAERIAEQLADTADDPWLVGYFLGDDPHWRQMERLLATRLLLRTGPNETRRAYARYLRDRYDSAADLSAAWGVEVTFEDVASTEWDAPPSGDRAAPFGEGAEDDALAFTGEMIERFYAVLTEQCREVDPNHLCLGFRAFMAPERWEVAGIRHTDVYSAYCYLPAPVTDEFDTLESIEAADTPGFDHVSDVLDLPVLICEWGVGSYDSAAPTPGLTSVQDQRERAKCYRYFVETAAAQEWCVGTHWFRLYDQAVTGRTDGENGNYGLLDVCNRPYEELVESARETHERLYEIADGRREPTDERPDVHDTMFLA